MFCAYCACVCASSGESSAFLPKPSALCSAEVGPGEGGGLHPEEAAPGLAAVLLCPQRAAVPQENSHAGANAGLHAGTGSVSVASLHRHLLLKD